MPNGYTAWIYVHMVRKQVLGLFRVGVAGRVAGVTGVVAIILAPSPSPSIPILEFSSDSLHQNYHSKHSKPNQGPWSAFTNVAFLWTF